MYFVTQNPLDIPDTVLGQLGNRIQHALRAFTPRDQKAVKTAAQTMRPNPGLDIEAAITELGVGEALVSLLDAKGRPTPTERAWILPPGSRIGPATDAERQALRQAMPLAPKYEQTVDRESAYEVLTARAAADAPATDGARAPAGKNGAPAAPAEEGGLMQGINEVLFGSTGSRGGKRDGVVQSVARARRARWRANWCGACWDPCWGRGDAERQAADCDGRRVLHTLVAIIPWRP